jgi:hypothetical protein
MAFEGDNNVVWYEEPAKYEADRQKRLVRRFLAPNQAEAIDPRLSFVRRGGLAAWRGETDRSEDLIPPLPLTEGKGIDLTAHASALNRVANQC